MATIHIEHDYEEDDFFSEFRPPINKKDQISHPKNCKNECPYGRDRAFCFPCMAKILAEHKAARQQVARA